MPRGDHKYPKSLSELPPAGEPIADFADNFDRLLGLHRLTATEAGQLLGVSPTTMSYWRNGKRVPNTDSLRRVCEFFEVGMREMLASPPEDVLFDRDRFQRVEARLRGTAKVLKIAGGLSKAEAAGKLRESAASVKAATRKSKAKAKS